MRRVELLERVVKQQTDAQTNLNEWRRSNPKLAHAYRKTADHLQRAYLAHLAKMTEEIIDKLESLKDSTFLRSEVSVRWNTWAEATGEGRLGSRGTFKQASRDAAAGREGLLRSPREGSPAGG